jgi:hypothetical protein
MAGPVSDKGKVSKNRHKYSQIRRQLTIQASCEGDQLRLWQKKLAIWYADQLKKPKVPQVQAEAEKLTGGQPLSVRSIEHLLRNPAFQSLVMQYEEENTSRARVELENGTVEAVKSHLRAITELENAGKWEHIAKFTNPIIDRVWPAKEGATQPAQIIQISVGAPGSFSATHAKLTNAIEVQAVEVQDGG